MNEQDWLRTALANMHSGQWFGWRKTDDDGNKIPNDQRMTYENVVVIKDGITKPTEAEVNAKIAELQQADADKETKKASGKQKLRDLGLDDAEIKALIGV